MSNKNFNHNDHESFMEGIYGCLERIETGIIELQKAKQNNCSSAVDNDANEALVEEIKALVANATGLNCRHTDRKLDEQTKVLNSNFSAIGESVRDVKAIVNKSQSSSEILNSLAEIKQNQEQKSEEVKTLVQKLKTTIEDGVHNFKHHRIGFETPFVCWTIVIETMLILGLFAWIIISEKPNQNRIDNDLKYRYIKMKGDASAEQIATLENICELNRDNQKIELMREDVETYEEAVRKQAALAEQARLKGQAAKEQESKAKSIKNKQQPKDNPNKKSKP
ncbi:MAG: hypothetical protein J6R01_05705 [Alistipes sp.]|nr:hypothetical protein [Paludibacteraceae bacterium]MBO5831081.1 hypothetical protein [Alistipes sp.]